MSEATTEKDILDGLPRVKLTLEEEKALLAKEEKADLILAHMREAFLYVRRCCRDKLPQDEIFSLCYKALVQAAANYKPYPGSPRFFGYCKVYLRGEISREWKRKDIVRNSSGHAETLELEEFGDDSGCPEVMPARPKKAAATILPTVEPDWEGVFSKDLIAALEPAIRGRLTNQEQLVLAMHYSQDLNFSEIGRLLGVSRAASQSTHGSALKKLRCALTARERLLE